MTSAGGMKTLRPTPAECRRMVFDALDSGMRGSAHALARVIGISPRTAGKYLVQWERERGIQRSKRLDTRGRKQPARKRWTSAPVTNEADVSAAGWVVYFIQDESGPIKIGKAFGSVSERLAALQVGNPRRLTLLAASDAIDEGAMHRRFANARIAGEWFEPTDELVGLIRGLR